MISNRMALYIIGAAFAAVLISHGSALALAEIPGEKSNTYWDMRMNKDIPSLDEGAAETERQIKLWYDSVLNSTDEAHFFDRLIVRKQRQLAPVSMFDNRDAYKDIAAQAQAYLNNKFLGQQYSDFSSYLTRTTEYSNGRCKGKNTQGSYMCAHMIASLLFTRDLAFFSGFFITVKTDEMEKIQHIEVYPSAEKVIPTKIPVNEDSH